MIRNDNLTIIVFGIMQFIMYAIFIYIIFFRFVSVVLPLVFSGVLEHQAMGRPAPAATTALARPRQPNVFQGQLLKPTIHFWAPQFRENSFQKVEKIFLLHFNFNYFQCDQKKLLNVYIKVVQKWFHNKNDRFWHLYRSWLRMWEIWAN